MPNVKIVYKKSANSGFITIEAELVGSDNDYVYLKCGKYLRKNIISYKEIYPPTVGKVLKDDA